MRLIPFFIAAAISLAPSCLLADYALSLDSKPKYPPNFTHFDYASPQAATGGKLTLHGIGAFDKMNPFTFKGIAPEWLSGLLIETLTVASLDEPFARYGLVAQDVEVAADRLSVIYTLNPEARFADGSPVTAADVQFSFNLLRSEKGHPFYRTYWKDIQSAEILDEHRVRFHFTEQSRELPMIAGEVPVLSQAFFTKHNFEENLTVPLGSGPYLVEGYDMGKTITYHRQENYWGKNLPVRRGQFNFEQIIVKYFRDPVARF